MPTSPQTRSLLRESESVSFQEQLKLAIERAQQLLLNHQFPDGYWWYTLEANETIGAEYLFLREFLGIPDPNLSQALSRRMLSEQRDDGSWAIYFNGPGDLSTTVECYWALKMSGY